MSSSFESNPELNTYDLGSVIFVWSLYLVAFLLFAAVIMLPVLIILAKDSQKAQQMKKYWDDKWPDERTPDEKTLLRPSHVESKEKLLRPAGAARADKESLVRPSEPSV